MADDIWAEDQDPKDYDPDKPETHPLNCDCFLCIPGA
jgi:hypothetical protein